MNISALIEPEVAAATQQRKAAPGLDDIKTLLRDCFEFTKYAAAPFLPDIPTHPSADSGWRAGLCARVENLQLRLLDALEDLSRA